MPFATTAVGRVVSTWRVVGGGVIADLSAKLLSSVIIFSDLWLVFGEEHTVRANGAASVEGWRADPSSGRLRGEALPTPVVLLDQNHRPGRPMPVSPGSPQSQILQRIREAKMSCQESTHRRGGSQGSRARLRYWRRRTIVRVAAPAAYDDTGATRHTGVVSGCGLHTVSLGSHGEV